MHNPITSNRGRWNYLLDFYSVSGFLSTFIPGKNFYYLHFSNRTNPIKFLKKVLILALIVAFFISCSNNKNLEQTSLRDRVIDHAHVFTNSQRDSINNVIEKLETEIGSEIGVLTVANLGGQTIEAFSLNKADSLGLGRASYNDGILITVAMQERQARIEVGTGLENIIKDEIAARIIREDIAPKFREAKYGRGIYDAVAKISQLITDSEKLIGTQPKE